MNYYPTNFYSSYPYQQQAPAQMIPGKIIESSDMMKMVEVPFGSYGIFPKADFSEVYIKMWNNNGTTKIIEFKPTITEPVIPQEENLNKENIDLILTRLAQLETKLDSMITAPVQKRKELSANDY